MVMGRSKGWVKGNPFDPAEPETMGGSYPKNFVGRYQHAMTEALRQVRVRARQKAIELTTDKISSTCKCCTAQTIRGLAAGGNE